MAFKLPVFTPDDVFWVITTPELLVKNMDIFPIITGDNPVDVTGLTVTTIRSKHADHDLDMFDILVDSGIFKSKSDARKNWKRSGAEIPMGYTEFLAIGNRKRNIFIWRIIDTEGM